jgi:hypothetical protein
VKDATDLLAFFTTQDGIVRFFTLLFPGFLAVAVYDLRVPGERRKYGDLGIALVGYSVLIDILAFVFLRLVPIPIGNAWAVVAFVVVAGLAVPCAVGWFIVELRELLAKQGLVLSTMPKAWDYFFTDLAKKGEPVAIVLMLSDGRRIGGFWAETPFASSFPADEDLLITVPCEIDQKTGQILKRIAGAKGLLVKRADIVTIEAFDAEAAIASETEPSETPPPLALPAPTEEQTTDG